MEKEIKRLNLVLGTLIVYLQRELGVKNAEDLLKMLNGDEEK